MGSFRKLGESPPKPKATYSSLELALAEHERKEPRRRSPLRLREEWHRDPRRLWKALLTPWTNDLFKPHRRELGTGAPTTPTIRRICFKCERSCTARRVA